MFAEAELSDDGFLGGRLRILQPLTGYRAATDPVLLAAAAPAKPGDTVLELGCGAGVASLCLGARVDGLQLTGLERQASYADLARRNAERNAIRLEVVEGDLSTMPAVLKRPFAHVIVNPPFFSSGDGTAARDEGREAAQREETPLALWLDAAARRLQPNGWLTMIHLASRLSDVLAACDARLGSISVLPLVPRADRPATRILLRARKGGRAAFRLLSPLVLHQGAQHLADGDDFTSEAKAVLREGCAITRL
ncbi:MAG: methyltransferase [Cereibacter sphaeroides]|uniref:Methyltransferase n=1 Tax=Cereibacter sphaeroides TaxID=1063 RepID=A0A2W5S4P8_CERSP|nr:MAG: methyltransferase [Cereibacter sphaeroides]